MAGLPVPGSLNSADSSTEEELTAEVPDDDAVDLGSDTVAADALEPISGEPTEAEAVMIASRDRGVVEAPTSAEMVQRPDVYAIRWDPEIERPFTEPEEFFEMVRNDDPAITEEFARAATFVPLIGTGMVYLSEASLINALKEDALPGYHLVFHATEQEHVNQASTDDPWIILKRHVLADDYRFVDDFFIAAPNEKIDSVIIQVNRAAEYIQPAEETKSINTKKGTLQQEILKNRELLKEYPANIFYRP